MTDKEFAINAIEELPDSYPLERIEEELHILSSIKKSQEASLLGKTKSHEEVESLLSSWISK